MGDSLTRHSCSVSGHTLPEGVLPLDERRAKLIAPELNRDSPSLWVVSVPRSAVSPCLLPVLYHVGLPDGIRTRNELLHKQPPLPGGYQTKCPRMDSNHRASGFNRQLYQLSYKDIGASTRIRTETTGLEDRDAGR